MGSLIDTWRKQPSSINGDLDNGLSFWVDRQSSYPSLALIAEDFVSSLASQAYVERVFSVCGDLCARKRNRLSVNLERRVFLKVNRQYVKSD